MHKPSLRSPPLPPRKKKLKKLFRATVLKGVKLNYSLRVVARDIISWLLFLTCLKPLTWWEP